MYFFFKGKQRNSKKSIDQKHKKKEIVKERKKQQSRGRKRKIKMGNLVVSFAHSEGVAFCIPPPPILKWGSSFISRPESVRRRT